ncbi:MAG: ABC transporter permease subunit [Alphaproteobacteria bacterium]|nr:ABC transporter permease subunit [Alphaproteobacteria bacterium]
MDAADAPRTARPSGITRRVRETRRSVLIADRVADWTIRIGGIFVIIAVATILVFLTQVVVPLFTGARVVGQHAFAVAGMERGPLSAVIDEDRTIGAVLLRDGSVSAFHLQTGTPLAAEPLALNGAVVTAFGSSLNREQILLGFADGTIRLGTMRFTAEVITPDRLPPDLRRLNERDRTDGRSVYSRIPGNQYRKVDVVVRADAPQKISESAIRLADYRVAGTVERPTRSFATVDAARTIRLSRAESRVNMLTRQVRTAVATTTLPPVPPGVEISAVLLTEQADSVLAGTAEGRVFRYDTRSFTAPRLAEEARLLEAGERLSALSYLIGEQSVVAMGSRGTTDVFFLLERPGSDSADGKRLVRAHIMDRHADGVGAISISQRGKVFATADARGNVWLRHSTSNRTLLALEKGGEAETYAALALAPRNDAIVAIAGNGRASAWNLSVPHPETTLGTIFGRVWYEGYQEPGFTWQSSAATDSFEPKLSLVPLIFGTLKATFYALLFAVPVALLAAIFTSEFVHPRVRAVVKPAMEMMASLPSVVLGFVAALILAPIVEDWIAAVLMVFLAVPLSLLAAAYAWMYLPRSLSLRYGGLPKFALMFVALGLGFLACVALGGALERIVFAGDIRSWLDGQIGSGFGFTTLLCLPITTLAAALVGNRLMVPLDEALGPRSHGVVATVTLLRWLVILVAGLVGALGLSALLMGLGYDPRGGMVGTYVQRNTLVVGFAMGFAVIPIIYTIAEDALSAVPEHLRAASLGCGATNWQTAMRVILPTAMSGVFAAVMVGMGRAVGETMIVVMAAGNTPILDWNVFNGLRALSANIAVELPEAVRDGTLYRMLFLSALTLFAITFVINTVAELIRLRFRKRAASL